MPIPFKVFKKMVSKNKSMSQASRKRAIATYKRRFKKVQKRI
jgi:hypothetical protein|tara:strand:- start:711 stop:836 length:126 start_codon:yes stop_codon:yes gene_type:complete